jgi:phage shock protein E
MLTLKGETTMSRKMRSLLPILSGMMIFGLGGGKTTTNEGVGSVKKIKPVQVYDMLKAKGDFLLVDVRTPSEYAEVHIPGSILLPLDQIDRKAQSVLTDKDRNIVVYCRSGARSNQAAHLLVSMGYKQINDMGGIMSWPFETQRG